MAFYTITREYNGQPQGPAHVVRLYGDKYQGGFPTRDLAAEWVARQPEGRVA